MPHHPLIATLQAIVGEAHVLTHGAPDADLSAWEHDWRKRQRGVALAVVRPAHTLDVAAVVKACAAAGVAIVP
ncbi:MAG TPA: hydroxyacid dehydrogenase, partial [Burkholderiaceae bacterium]|nr:hydroxyacid dehydrogenase [Burkholderiaceae bacterium]